MAELPNRMDLEAEFQRKLSRLSSRHRRELRELLGTPPDPRNVPDEFWRRVENERNAEMLLLLLLITQESQRLHVGELLPDALQDLPADALASVARDWSGRRAASVAAGNVAKARERLAVRADFWRNFGGAVPSEQLEGDLVDVFGPRMDSATAATETTSAQTAGANGAIGAAEAFGYRVATRWYTAKDDRVCPVCAPLHGKHVDLWELVLRNVVAPGGTRAIESIALNGGPPAHPSCRCYVTTTVEAPARRVRTGVMAEATREDVRWVTIDDHPVPIVNGEIALPKAGKSVESKTGKSDGGSTEPKRVAAKLNVMPLTPGMSSDEIAARFHKRDGNPIEGDIAGFPVTTQERGLIQRVSKKTVAELENALSDPETVEVMRNAGIGVIRVENKKGPTKPKEWTAAYTNGTLYIHSRTAEDIASSSIEERKNYGLMRVIHHEAGHAFWDRGNDTDKRAFIDAIEANPSIRDHVAKIVNIKPPRNAFDYDEKKRAVSEVFAELTAIKKYDPKRYADYPSSVRDSHEKILSSKMPAHLQEKPFSFREALSLAAGN